MECLQQVHPTSKNQQSPCSTSVHILHERMHGFAAFHNTPKVFFMKTITIALLTIALSAFVINPERTITGRVTDSQGAPLPGVSVVLKGSSNGVTTDAQGRYSIQTPSAGGVLVFSFIGFVTQEVTIARSHVIDVQLIEDVRSFEEVVVTGYNSGRRDGKSKTQYERPRAMMRSMPAVVADQVYAAEPDTEEYSDIDENIFHGADKKPLSTFSIDVDAASYSNVRRFINNGQIPPKDAVRIEEMINYFDYSYEEPRGAHPFNVYTEVGRAPWNGKHMLVHIGLQGRRVPVESLPPANLVFLIDVSGSMNQPNKLPLVKRSFEMLVDQLRPEDHVAIAVYAGAAGIVLEPTPGNEKRKILAAIQRLHAGGSTAGEAGLRTAYALAQEHYKSEGNNRVILATDGDFNVGESSNEAMEELIEEKRKEGVFLTVLGYGIGNLKDSKMEILADKGNGNYAYIDNLNEARKVLVNEFGGTLFTIATDVKLQVEFNPATVKAYRLIGYENRKLNDEDFNNDRKDAGDLGSGHTVTALYEVIPVGVESAFYAIDDLKYQTTRSSVGSTSEWLTVKLRYKHPNEQGSRLIEQIVKRERAGGEPGEDFRWSACVAAFGMLLRDSQYLNDMTPDAIVALARQARGEDPEGYRSEFINLVKSYSVLSRDRVSGELRKVLRQ